MHTADALKGGETTRRLALLPTWRETRLFSEREQAALRWTEAITRVSETHVPDEDWAAVRPRFSEQEVMDLTLLIIASC